LAWVWAKDRLAARKIENGNMISQNPKEFLEATIFPPFSEAREYQFGRPVSTRIAFAATD
jgi:hypothetical protein